MAASLTCPRCGITITGDLARIRAHLSKCERSQKPAPHAPMGTPGVVGIPELPYAIRVPLKIESQNKSQYSHWTIYKIYKDKWFRGLGAYLGPLKGTRLAWSKWTLNRVYSGRAREMDYGNYVGGAKGPIDALMHWGVIVDDKPSCFACTYIQTRGDENSVVLTLEEARIT